MRNYRDLIVFQRAHDVALRVDALSASISARRHPSLSAKLRRAAASVPANIAEGCGHSSRREFARVLQLALASNVEVDYHLLFARDVGAVPESKQLELTVQNQEVRRMLAALLRRVRTELKDENAGPETSMTDTATVLRNAVARARAKSAKR